MKKYLKVVVLALFISLISACGSSSGGGSNAGSVNNGDLNVNEGEILKSVNIALINGEDGTYTFESEYNFESSNITYTWEFGGRINQPAQRSVANPVISYIDEGDYTVQLTVVADGEVLKSNTINISYYQPVKVKTNYSLTYGYTTGIYANYFLAGAVTDKKLYFWEQDATDATLYNLDNEAIKDIFFTADVCIVLTESGKLYTYGPNRYGNLGDNTSVSRKEFKVVEALNDVVIKKVYTNATAVYAIDSEGKLYGWGADGYGGLNDSANNKVPGLIEGLKDKFIVSVAQNTEGSVWALDADGNVYSWGHDANGELGHGTISNLIETKIIEYFRDNNIKIRKIISGNKSYSTYAIDTDGNAYSWGLNSRGQLGLDLGTENQSTPVLIGPLSNKKMVNITINNELAFAVENTGQIYVAGNNNNNYLGSNSYLSAGVVTGFVKMYNIPALK